MNRPNAELLRVTLAHISTHPRQWDQTRTHRQDAMSFIGWALTLAGGKWAASEGTASLFLVAEPDDPPEDIREVGSYGPIVQYRFRAKRLLRLDEGQYRRLADRDATLEDLRRVVAGLCAEAVYDRPGLLDLLTTT